MKQRPVSSYLYPILQQKQKHLSKTTFSTTDMTRGRFMYRLLSKLESFFVDYSFHKSKPVHL